MKLLSFIYIFALTIICCPGIFIKYKNLLLHALIFVIIFYFTFDFVNKDVENYEQYNVNIQGVDSLVDLLKSNENQPKQIDINNNLFQNKGASEANCWNALGKNQKDLEIIKVQLNSYAGKVSTTDELNKQLENQKEEVEQLQEKLKGYEGTKTEIDQINSQIKKYQTEIDKLQQQINIYNQSESTIGDVNKQIAKVQTAITDLNVKITTCNDVNKEKESNITKLTTLITNQNSKIKDLESKKSTLPPQIADQKEKIASLEKTINDKVGCGEKLKLIFVIPNITTGTGAYHAGTKKFNELYLTYNNDRVTNVADLSGKVFNQGSQYSVELKTNGNNKLINGLYVDIGNDGVNFSTIAIEIMVNGRWERLTFSNGSDRYNLRNVSVKNRSRLFTFDTISVSPSIWFYNPEHAKQEDHQNHAKKYGGNLASFHSAEELNSVISKFDNRASCWIGGKRKSSGWDFITRITRSRIGNSSEWEWYDGSSWNYTNWNTNEPNSYKEGGLQLLNGGTWNDKSQNGKIPGLYKLTTPRISIPGSRKLIV